MSRAPAQRVPEQRAPEQRAPRAPEEKTNEPRPSEPIRIGIVVARYLEDVTWTEQFNNVVIYNKGQRLDVAHRLLPNVGREGHTYYTHICKNYHDLDDYTIFLQGNPFDHSAHIVDQIHAFTASPQGDFLFLSDNVLQCNLKGCDHHAKIPLIDVYERLFGVRKEELNFEFGAGAQFIVSKKQILARPLSFYTKIVSMLATSNNPSEGYVIERFHKLIFE